MEKKNKNDIYFRMVHTEQLSYTYPGEETIYFPDMHFERGEQSLLLGPSGSGKTTLLHLLGGLRTTKNGKVSIDQTDLASLSRSELDHFRGKNIGIVFQQAHFVRSLDVEENLLLAQQLAGQRSSLTHIREILQRLNLDHKLKARTDALSQGEQQRVAIARALINKPSLILADEPTSALDDGNCHEVLELLRQQAKAENATLLIVTHDSRLKEDFDNHVLLQ